MYSNLQDGDGTIGYYDTTTYTITPGNTWDSDDNQYAPYGQWKVKNMWTTSDYAYHGVGADWGIIEVYTKQGQDWPGRVAGMASAEWDLVMPSGSYFCRPGTRSQERSGGCQRGRKSPVFLREPVDV